MQINEGENLKNSVPILLASVSQFCFAAFLMTASTWLTVAQTQKVYSQQESGLSAVQAPATQ